MIGNSRTLQKNIICLCLMVALILPLASCADGSSTGSSSRDETAFLSEKGTRIGVSAGSIQDILVNELYPDADIEYYDMIYGYTAVAQGKLDAYTFDKHQMEIAIENGMQGVRILDSVIGEPTEVAFGISPRSSIPNLEGLVNRFISEIKGDGTLDDIFERWSVNGDYTMPEIELPSEPAYHLVVGTTGDVEPYSFYEGNILTGYDIELAYRFAAWLGADLEFAVYDWGSIVPAAQSGKVDIIASNLNVTPERQEALTFSDALYEIENGVMVQDSDSAQQLTPSDFNGMRSGVITGSFHDSVIAEELPDSAISQYNSYTDMVAALKAKKIDYFLASTEVAGSLIGADNALAALDEPIRMLDIGAMFAMTEEGAALRSRMDEFIEKIKADGTLDEIYSFWSDSANESTAVDMSGLTGENGTLQFATSGTKVPISFVANGQIAGTDPDIAVRFCREYGYGIEVNIVDTAGIIPGIVTGMYDFSLSDMVITDERKESVNFSVPYHGTELLVVTLNEAVSGSQNANEDGAGFLSNIKDSFNKTFIREDRWKLFLSGIGTTALITILSVLCGTLLGFLIFMLCRKGNPIANGVSRFCFWLVQGTPMVVLLMILYYIIFGKIAIPGSAVAVIGFTLTFGAGVFGILKIGVGTIDRGQYEAAYALGHTERHTFFRVILPQAIPHVLPAYQGEIVGLLKATAIVGYIAVQDLTKMGDIVRSRTYEAFFPLIAVTIIYFVLEGLFSFLVGRIRVSSDPKKRTAEKILKGVKTDD